MRRLLVAGVVLVVPVVFAPAAPVPAHLTPKPVWYFPTKVGAKRTYECTRSNRGQMLVTEEIVYLVTAVETKGPEKIVSESVVTGDTTIPAWVTAVSGRGLFLRESPDKRFAAPPCLLKLPHTPRNEWTIRPADSIWASTLGRSQEVVHRTVGVEQVTVPAGTFSRASGSTLRPGPGRAGRGAGPVGTPPGWASSKEPGTGDGCRNREGPEVLHPGLRTDPAGRVRLSRRLLGRGQFQPPPDVPRPDAAVGLPQLADRFEFGGRGQLGQPP